uniref:Uncharacterized protein n=1 Tax=Lactuca sativa TaxID=4236 RepID=A0A9R1XBE5_LACSA|nr:hypothetical protein LSAT_V11C500243690 [Lactuca sativa]
MQLFSTSNRRMLNTVFTPYAEMVLQRRMQKRLRWKATKIPPEIPFPFPSDIFQVFDLKRSLVIACGHAIAAACYTKNTELTDIVQIYYLADVFQTTYQTRNVNVVPRISEWEIPEPLMVILIPM